MSAERRLAGLRRVALALLVLATVPASASTPPTGVEPERDSAASACSPRVKKQRQRALAAFKRAMPRQRRNFYAGHRSAAQRRKYVKQQQARLKTLQRAVNLCAAKRPTPPVPPVSPGPAQPTPTPPTPPPPVAAPPPLGPGAPATYTFGPELAAAQQDLVRRGLDAGARYYRSALGRELPPFAVGAYASLDGIVSAHAAATGTPVDQSRALWQGGQVGHATTRQVWLGPSWFAGATGGGVPNALKIAAHETFHLFQYELVGQAALSVSGLDEIPRAGPWWLAEGTAEYFAYLAIVQEGSFTMPSAESRWKTSTKATTATLQTLATLRGQREVPGAYDIYALATQVLLRDRDPKLVFAYYEAIARGAAWADAFATTFGRSIDGFVAEFEAYRQTL